MMKENKHNLGYDYTHYIMLPLSQCIHSAVGIYNKYEEKEDDDE